mgnify:CR=1 FL=1
MKTPLAELIENVKKLSILASTDGERFIFNLVDASAKQLLEDERGMVEAAYEKGSDNAHDWHSDPRGGNLSAEQYFNENFEQ